MMESLQWVNLDVFSLAFACDFADRQFEFSLIRAISTPVALMFFIWCVAKLWNARPKKSGTEVSDLENEFLWFVNKVGETRSYSFAMPKLLPTGE